MRTLSRNRRQVFEARFNRGEDPEDVVSPWVRWFVFTLNSLILVLCSLLVAFSVAVVYTKYGELTSYSDRVITPVDALLDPAVILGVLASLVCLIALFGFIGALRENICCLKTFSRSMFALIIIQILILIFIVLLIIQPVRIWMSERYLEFESYLNRTTNVDLGIAFAGVISRAIEQYRFDLDLTGLIDDLQQQFKCCGFMNYTDWGKNLYFICNQSSPNENPSVDRCSVPWSCCRDDKLRPDMQAFKGTETQLTANLTVNVTNRLCGRGLLLASADAMGSIYADGCWESLINVFAQKNLEIGIAFICTLIPQMIAVSCSRTLSDQILLQAHFYERRHGSARRLLDGESPSSHGASSRDRVREPNERNHRNQASRSGGRPRGHHSNSRSGSRDRGRSSGRRNPTESRDQIEMRAR